MSEREQIRKVLYVASLKGTMYRPGEIFGIQSNCVLAMDSRRVNGYSICFKYFHQYADTIRLLSTSLGYFYQIGDNLIVHSHRNIMEGKIKFPLTCNECIMYSLSRYCFKNVETDPKMYSI